MKKRGPKPKAKSQRKKHINITIDPGLLAQLKKISGISLSTTINELLKKALLRR